MPARLWNWVLSLKVECQNPFRISDKICFSYIGCYLVGFTNKNKMFVEISSLAYYAWWIFSLIISRDLPQLSVWWAVNNTFVLAKYMSWNGVSIGQVVRWSLNINIELSPYLLSSSPPSLWNAGLFPMDFFCLIHPQNEFEFSSLCVYRRKPSELQFYKMCY